MHLKSIWNYKCPRCRKGDMFIKPFDIKKPLDMPKACAHCAQVMEPEPGFYYGAMFLSYIISGFMFLIPGLTLIFLFKWTVNQAMLLVLVIAILSFLKLLRGSRALWLHLMIKYEGENVKKYGTK